MSLDAIVEIVKCLCSWHHVVSDLLQSLNLNSWQGKGFVLHHISTGPGAYLDSSHVGTGRFFCGDKTARA
jgi:hypothetical protein